MEALQNRVFLDCTDNIPLKDVVANWKVGQKVSFTIEAQVDDIVNNGDSATLTLESISPDDYENPDPKPGESDDEIKSSASSPVMLAIGDSLTPNNMA